MILRIPLISHDVYDYTLLLIFFYNDLAFPVHKTKILSSSNNNKFLVKVHHGMQARKRCGTLTRSTSSIIIATGHLYSMYEYSNTRHYPPGITNLFVVIYERKRARLGETLSLSSSLKYI